MNEQPESGAGAASNPTEVKPVNECMCRHCIAHRPKVLVGMIVCETCGNKRCPHATHHRHKCTNSNETGQPGSIYV